MTVRKQQVLMHLSTLPAGQRVMFSSIRHNAELGPDRLGLAEIQDKLTQRKTE